MQRYTIALLVGTVLSAPVSPAMAGGFQRGIADTDILYERGTFATRFGLTYVDPQRGFSSVNGVRGDFDDYTGTYAIPNYAIYFGSDAFGCAANFTESFAAEADYTGTLDGALPRQVSSTRSGAPVTDRLDFGNALTTSRTRSIEFGSDEYSGTCRVSHDFGKSRISLIGGVFAEDFSFEGSSFGERNLTGAFAGTPLAGAGALLNASGSQLLLPTQIDVDSRSGNEYGFRIGAAYEIPEIALRVQALYRSEVKHDGIKGDGRVEVLDSAFVRLANGTQVSVPTFFSNPNLPLTPLQRRQIIAGIGAATPADGTTFGVMSRLNEATSPQYLTLNAQTGIAEGTLLLASFRWTDWSTNEEVISTIESAALGSSAAVQPYYWRDGYTASLGIGRAFNESVSGLISIGYDRGTSTGADTTYTDLYTLSGGISLKPEKFGEIRLGGLVGYWTDGEQSISDGAYFDGKVGNDFVWAINGSLKLTF